MDKEKLDKEDVVKERTWRLLKNAIEELNEQLEDDERLDFSEDLRLIGSKSSLDSMSLVTLISIIEELITDEFDLEVRLISDKSFSKSKSPFYSARTLHEFILELLDEGAKR